MMQLRFFFTAFLGLFFLQSGFPPMAQAASPIHELTLSNGLRVIVKEDHRAPVMVSQVWYKVGSSYEHDGITGVSHVLEHMMFKGTRTHSAGEFSRIIAANGGRENAFTGQDYTAYFQQMEKSRLKVSFELEADRMRNLILPKEEFLKEVKVVMEERRLRTDDDPQSLTYEQFAAAAFVTSPYRYPIIGWMDDLENMRIEDLRAWYEKWYAPNNATVVVVGDVKAAEVFALAKKYFGPLKSGKITPSKPRLEIEQKGVRRITVKAPAELPVMMMGYKVPVVKTAPEAWEPYALEMLAGVLDGGDSARFAKELVRGSQIAASIGTGYNLYNGAQDLLTFSGTPSQGHSAEALENAIRAQIKRLHDELVNEQDLTRIKAQVVASKVYELDSPFYQAMQIGTLVTVGLSPALLDEYVDKLNAVTPEQVQQVARKYLIDDRLTVAVLEPQPLDEKAQHRAPANAAGGRHGH